MYFVGGRRTSSRSTPTPARKRGIPAEPGDAGGAIRRGMSYWPGTPRQAPRVLVTMSGGKLVQLDAKTGTLVPGVGVIDLVNGIMDRIPGGESYTIASPVAVYKNLAIFPGPHRRAQSLGHSRRSARVRSADRQGSVALPHRSAARRSELRHVGPERLAGSQGPGLVAAADRRQRERPGLRRARQRRRSELRQQPARLEPLLRPASSRSTPPPASTSGTSRRRTTTSTTAT